MLGRTARFRFRDVVDHFHCHRPILDLAALLFVSGTVAPFVLGGPIRRITLEEPQKPD